ncbi:MAG: DUF4255 domain-containing protein [Bryobacterales bacterium]|nr:DUF4255 domain-containing protein [Bryobacterales bacterium]
MPGPFAVAAVTAVLKDILNDGLANHDLSALGNVAVTALPPDRIPATNAEEKSQLNLFLFQVSPNTGWRNAALPSRSSTGERLTNPPLALNLHYLITAYGKEEFHAEALLGYAMQMMHESPILTRAMINATLKPALPPGVTLPPGLGMISTSDLADQVEMVKITPQHLSAEEMSRLWSAMQAKYRPTAVYEISVILIEADKAKKSPLPVLKQGDDGKGPAAQADLVPPFPEILSVTFPNNQTQAMLGDAVILTGHDLAGETGKAADVTVSAQLVSPRLDAPLLVAIPVAARSANTAAFTIPPTPLDVPAGVYSLSLVVSAAAPADPVTSNEVAIAIAPRITGGLAAPVARTAVDPETQLGTAVIAITCSPEVLPSQRVSLVIGTKEVRSAPLAGQTALLQFTATGLAAGEHWIRLRVDGAESLLIDRADPADVKFDATQKLVLT